MSVRSEKIWVDGEMVDWDDARFHVMSHALHYGTAYFEGIRCYSLDGERSAVFRLPEHLQRFGTRGTSSAVPCHTASRR